MDKKLFQIKLSWKIVRERKHFRVFYYILNNEHFFVHLLTILILIKMREL